MSNEYAPAPPLNDPRNITVGTARVIWAEKLDNQPAGWVLPGGLRTNSQYRAQNAAMRMDQMMVSQVEQS